MKYDFNRDLQIRSIDQTKDLIVDAIRSALTGHDGIIMLQLTVNLAVAEGGGASARVVTSP